MTIKDSGTRRQFDSGAVRDMQEGKGRCDLLPACAILRVAQHFEAGAKKYEDRNWEKGIPVGSFIDSAIRHLMKYLDGQADEDHLCAAGWNILCAMWTEEKRPDLINIPTRPEYEESKCETNEVETTKKPPEAIYIGFNSHDCETRYKCPVCNGNFGSWSLPSGAKIANCPCCGTELQF